MELSNEFSLSIPADESWPLLTDVERIAPCVPGFQLKGKEGDEYSGTMKVKVGAVQNTYDCVIRFVELDEQEGRAVIAAQGQDTRGQGGVTASITSSLSPEDEGTHIKVVTDLNVTGRVAQFGRGILADVSNRLVKQFVSCLESSLVEQPSASNSDSIGQDATVEAGEQPSAAGAESSQAESEALNLLSVAGGPLIKRVAPAAIILVLLGFLIVRMRGRGAR
jgi:uncharacterized protein